MVVALSAVEADTEEVTRAEIGRVGDAERKVSLDQVNDGRVVLELAGGGEQFGRDTVPACTVKAIDEPFGKCLLLESIVQLRREEPAGPQIGEVLSETRGGQQLVDQLGPLVGIGAIEEGRRLF